jgi:hypothetical protein
MRYDPSPEYRQVFLRSLALDGWEDRWKRKISKSGNFGIQIPFFEGSWFAPQRIPDGFTLFI